MLKQKSQHSDEHIKAATLIYEERGLADPKKQELIAQYPALRNEVMEKYKEGMKAEDLITYMTAKGVSLQDTKEMIANVVRKEKKEFEKLSEKKRNKSLLIGIGLAYTLHPKNRHQGRYDLESLITVHPLLGNYTIKNKEGDNSIKFSDPKAVKALNAAFHGIIRDKDYFDLTICNPPFYKSAEEALKNNDRKNKNLHGKKSNKTKRNFSGQATELWTIGGEKQFLKDMVYQSKKYGKQVGWFTTLVSREAHIPAISKSIESVKASKAKIIEMGTSNKSSRIVAWKF